MILHNIRIWSRDVSITYLGTLNEMPIRSLAIVGVCCGVVVVSDEKNLCKKDMSNQMANYSRLVKQ